MERVVEMLGTKPVINAFKHAVFEENGAKQILLSG
jgi:hypothetical protein